MLQPPSYPPAQERPLPVEVALTISQLRAAASSPFPANTDSLQQNLIRTSQFLSRNGQRGQDARQIELFREESAASTLLSTTLELLRTPALKGSSTPLFHETADAILSVARGRGYAVPRSDDRTLGGYIPVSSPVTTPPKLSDGSQATFEQAERLLDSLATRADRSPVPEGERKAVHTVIYGALKEFRNHLLSPSSRSFLEETKRFSHLQSLFTLAIAATVDKTSPEQAEAIYRETANGVREWRRFRDSSSAILPPRPKF